LENLSRLNPKDWPGLKEAMVNNSQVLINRYNQELSEIKPVEAEDDDQLAAL